jgi:hypothetical protein
MKIQGDLHSAVFIKSTYSNGGNNCIEVAAVPGTTAFRDSKDVSRGFVPMTDSAFDAFVRGVKAGSLR